MAALRAAKQALRKELKRRVAALSDQEKERQSRAVCEMLLKHPRYVSSQRIAVFLSMHDEVHTEQILHDVFQQKKTCFVPRYDSSSSHMDMLLLRDLQDLETLPRTAWNIQQPAGGDTSREEALDTGGLDLVLMPGLGFDRSGRRLGRGRGFYDTYLQRCRRRGEEAGPYTIALAFREQLCTEVPTDPHDQPVDQVLYEE